VRAIAAIGLGLLGLVAGGYIEHRAQLTYFGPVSFPLALLLGCLPFTLPLDGRQRRVITRSLIRTAGLAAALIVLLWLASIAVVYSAKAQVGVSHVLLPKLRLVAQDGPCAVRELVHPATPTKLVITCQSETGAIAMEVVQ
jgi:hypothetical protein